MKVRFAWDPISAILNSVVYEFTIGNSLANSGALTAGTQITGLTAPVTSVPNADGSLNLLFSLWAKASAANAATVLNLNRFETVGIYFQVFTSQSRLVNRRSSTVCGHGAGRN